MGFEQTEWVWMNGSCVRWQDATAHVSSHALHYGSGVFEGLRCYQTAHGPAVFRLDAHLERLFASAEAYQMAIPFSQDELADAICETIRRNRFSDCYIRPISYLGSASLSVHPRDCPVEVAILTWPWGAYLGDEAVTRGARITLSPWRKFHSRTMPTTAKACGQYLNSVLAVRDAAARGFDEALLLDQDGRLAEGSGENIFLLIGNKLVTNDEHDSILPGITRNCVLQIASDLRWEIEQRSLTLEDLLQCDEAFFTGTAVEVVPISELDGRAIGGGRRGHRTMMIQRIYSDATSGRHARYRNWLYPVEQKKTATAAAAAATRENAS